MLFLILHGFQVPDPSFLKLPEKTFQYIAIIPEAVLSGVMCDVAAELKRRHGSSITIYVRKKDSRSFFEERNMDGRFDNIVDAGHLTLKHNRVPAEGDTEIKRANIWEKKIRTPFNTLVLGDRHLGRGYLVGGWRHPKSKLSHDSSYSDLLRYYSDALDFWQSEFINRKITLVLGGNKEVAALARSLGIPYRNLLIGRFDTRYIWTHDEYSSQPEIEAVYRSLANSIVPPPKIGSSYLTAELDKPLWLSRTNIKTLIYNCTRQILRHVYWRLQGYEKAKTGYYLSSELLYFWRQFREMRRQTRLGMPQLKDIEGKSFVYFPLATEPETTLTTFSPDFFFQQTAILSIARDLPADTLLVIKESVYAVGRRPADMVDQIVALKNVLMLDIREPGLDVLRKARLVATITGTAGFEAAALGIPVISFWRECPYAFLPHVRVVADAVELRDALDFFLSEKFDRRKATQDGARYFRALQMVSADLGGFSHHDREAFDAKMIEELCDRLEGKFGTLSNVINK